MKRRKGEGMGRKEGRREGVRGCEEGIEGRGIERRKINIQNCLTSYRIKPKYINLINSHFYKLKKNQQIFYDTLNMKVLSLFKSYSY